MVDRQGGSSAVIQGPGNRDVCHPAPMEHGP